MAGPINYDICPSCGDRVMVGAYHNCPGKRLDNGAKIAASEPERLDNTPKQVENSAEHLDKQTEPQQPNPKKLKKNMQRLDNTRCQSPTGKTHEVRQVSVRGLYRNLSKELADPPFDVTSRGVVIGRFVAPDRAAKGAAK